MNTAVAEIFARYLHTNASMSKSMFVFMYVCMQTCSQMFAFLKRFLACWLLNVERAFAVLRVTFTITSILCAFIYLAFWIFGAECFQLICERYFQLTEFVYAAYKWCGIHVLHTRRQQCNCNFNTNKYYKIT